MEAVGDLYFDVGAAYAENGEYSVCTNHNKSDGFLSECWEQQVLSWNSVTKLWSKKNYKDLKGSKQEILGDLHLSL